MADRLARIIYRLRALVRPPVTLGVRLLVHDDAGRILLVRHTYAAGWHLPGGGVDPGESAREAAIREAREETGLVVAAPARLIGLYFNYRLYQRDHVALYAVTDHPRIAETNLSPQAAEIAETRLFPLSAPPEGLSAGTRRRLAEVFHGAEPSERW